MQIQIKTYLKLTYCTIVNDISNTTGNISVYINTCILYKFQLKLNFVSVGHNLLSKMSGNISQKSTSCLVIFITSDMLFK